MASKMGGADRSASGHYTRETSSELALDHENEDEASMHGRFGPAMAGSSSSDNSRSSDDTVFPVHRACMASARL